MTKNRFWQHLPLNLIQWLNLLKQIVLSTLLVLTQTNVFWKFSWIVSLCFDFFYSSVKMSSSPKPNFFLILVHTVNWNKLLELRSIGLLTSLIEISFPWLCVSHKTSIWLTDTSRTSRVHSELEKNMVLNRCSDVISYPKTPKPEGGKPEFAIPIPDPTQKNDPRTPTQREFWLL